jgi:ribosomal protein L37AE/L43A
VIHPIEYERNALMTDKEIKNGKCDKCGSINGYWIGESYWECEDCGYTTAYYRLTELGEQILKELLVKGNGDNET